MSMTRLKIFTAALLLATGSMACLPARADTGSTPVKAMTDQEVRNYASATAALLQLNNVVAARAATATPTERATIEQQANADRQMILGRYALDPTSFNAISKAVETNPALSDRVRQVMMDQVLGS